MVSDGWSPAWSPDGTSIAFADQGEIAVIDPDGSDRRTVATFPDHAVDRIAWSSDGAKLIFDLSDSSDRIATANLDGSGFTVVVDSEGSDFDPSLRP
jgi:TolB protein